VWAQEGIVAGDENAAAIAMIRRLAARPGGLSGVTIVADAKHTTRELTGLVTELGGYWVCTVKGNAPTALAACASLPWGQVDVAHATREKGPAARRPARSGSCRSPTTST
jgi:hypothetical protein